MEPSPNDSLPNFILSVDNDMARMSLKYANFILGSKPNLYRMVQQDGWYLPRPESRCVTTSYLFGVINGSVFRIKHSDIKPYLHEAIRLSKIDIICFIETHLIGDSKLGFGLEKLPDRSWLLNVLHTLDNCNEVFTGTRVVDKIVEIPLKY